MALTEPSARDLLGKSAAISPSASCADAESRSAPEGSSWPGVSIAMNGLACNGGRDLGGARPHLCCAPLPRLSTRPSCAPLPCLCRNRCAAHCCHACRRCSAANRSGACRRCGAALLPCIPPLLRCAPLPRMSTLVRRALMPRMSPLLCCTHRFRACQRGRDCAPLRA